MLIRPIDAMHGSPIVTCSLQPTACSSFRPHHLPMLTRSWTIQHADTQITMWWPTPSSPPPRPSRREKHAIVETRRRFTCRAKLHRQTKHHMVQSNSFLREFHRANMRRVPLEVQGKQSCCTESVPNISSSITCIGTSATCLLFVQGKDVKARQLVYRMDSG